jgi:hypothetical protein
MPYLSRSQIGTLIRHRNHLPALPKTVPALCTTSSEAEVAAGEAGEDRELKAELSQPPIAH